MWKTCQKALPVVGVHLLRWIATYPVDKVIHSLNNWGLVYSAVEHQFSSPLLQEKSETFLSVVEPAESTDRESFKASTALLDKFCFLYYIFLHSCLINIHIFDYPDILFKFQRVRIIEVRLYQVHGEDDP